MKIKNYQLPPTTALRKVHLFNHKSDLQPYNMEFILKNLYTWFRLMALPLYDCTPESLVSTVWCCIREFTFLAVVNVCVRIFVSRWRLPYRSNYPSSELCTSPEELPVQYMQRFHLSTCPAYLQEEETSWCTLKSTPPRRRLSVY